jgi:hypothetical protein
MSEGQSEQGRERDGTFEGVLGQGACMSFLLGRCPRERVILEGAPFAEGFAFDIVPFMSTGGVEEKYSEDMEEDGEEDKGE